MRLTEIVTADLHGVRGAVAQIIQEGVGVLVIPAEKTKFKIHVCHLCEILSQ